MKLFYITCRIFLHKSVHNLYILFKLFFTVINGSWSSTWLLLCNRLLLHQCQKDKYEIIDLRKARVINLQTESSNFNKNCNIFIDFQIGTIYFTMSSEYETKVSVNLEFFHDWKLDFSKSKWGNIVQTQVCEVGDPTLRHKRFTRVIGRSFVCASRTPYQFSGNPSP